MHEQRHHDTADHARLADDRRRRRRRRGPPEEDISRALTVISEADVPGTPRVQALKLLEYAGISSPAVGEREVVSFSITRGDPHHGAHRSDDHVGSYELYLPFRQVATDAFDGAECPECGEITARYTYSTNHHIAGYECVECVRCGHEVHGGEWY